ncbi:efflux RND transporter periplasmic adaptor subunit [Vibrio barjaei]|uniref:efflux RND transporter periplasmic adaptor subunit n=1 Tax=Vibrio barjaei TaxID=1676683 RepID=UPI002284A093|nr:efflux RND transporter periplasmic adaptor subunit [Vibrio barjaei]MCY9872961.1 efflux RND transporter periplasmic adaptor subunit [Vibrio barjaei]
MKKAILGLIVVVGSLFGTVLGHNYFKITGMMDKMANMPEPVYPVTVQTVESKVWQESVSSVGVVEAEHGVTVTTEMSGVVSDVFFESGQSVKQGQKLIALESMSERVEILGQRSRMTVVESKYKRYKELFQKGVVSLEAFEQSRSDFETLSADIAKLESKLNRRFVRAPFDGVVGIKNVKVGEYVTPGTKVVRIEELEDMNYRFTLPQRFISDIYIGQSLMVELPAFDNKPFAGVVTAIEPAVDVGAGLIAVEADVIDDSMMLRSGMYGRSELYLEAIEDQIVLPQTAVVYSLYGERVFVVDAENDNRVEVREVTLGARKDGSVRVLDGLKPGETIVTTGQVRLSAGAKVKVVESSATESPEELKAL